MTGVLRAVAKCVLADGENGRRNEAEALSSRVNTQLIGTDRGTTTYAKVDETHERYAHAILSSATHCNRRLLAAKIPYKLLQCDSSTCSNPASAVKFSTRCLGCQLILRLRTAITVMKCVNNCPTVSKQTDNVQIKRRVAFVCDVLIERKLEQYSGDDISERKGESFDQSLARYGQLFLRTSLRRRRRQPLQA